MSINVTVTGNPVRISRGKMVTCDSSKTEFDKRRLIRLAQVRQQSKDIAENIRNKLRMEKTKYLSEIEKEGEVKLKNWQTRKLLELQNQYREALDEIGLGHKEAVQIEDEEAVLVEREENNEKVAKERGRAALERLQIEKNEKNLTKATPIQRKKMTRDIENVRASVVTNAKNVRKTKKSQVFDSDAENRIPILVGLSDCDDELESSAFELFAKETHTLKTSKEQQTSPTDFQVPTSDKGLQTVASEEQQKLWSRAEFPVDTRISDRIKRRIRQNPEVDYWDSVEGEEGKKTLCDCCKCPVKAEESQKLTAEPTASDIIHKSKTSKKSFTPEEKPSEISVSHRSKDSNGLSENRQQQTKKPNVPFKNITELEKAKANDEQKHENSKLSRTTLKTTKSDIPSKPKVTLRSVKDRPAYIATEQNIPLVKFYDHPNRYSKLYVPKTSLIDKIDENELQISPNVLSDEEIREKMRQRDKEAHLRGLVALEKEKLQREYKELLKKLPVLQKQERICEIGMDKEKYHMSRDRLEELEKKRQNRLDNAYEELFVRRKPTVTLRQRKDDKDEPPTLNLAHWDSDFDSTKDDRTQQLEDLLTNLKSQKASLLKEFESTLSKETPTQLVDNGDIKSKSTDYPRTQAKRKRSRNEEQTLSTSRKTTTTPLSTRTTSPSPRKKPKLKKSKAKKKVTVLQNSSTQTTPSKTERHSAATSPLVNTPVTESETCTCPKNLDDLCEIVIKIKEDEKPEVSVNPPFLENAVKIVTEEKEKVVPRKKEKDESKKNGSWGKHLSSTVSSKSSTSTSYRELPKKGVLKKSVVTEEVSHTSSSNASTMKPLDPRLLTYIKKLLGMSRASIDDLTVSAASDVSTPTPSVIETPSNNPLLQLRNVMKYFNIDATELQRQFNYTTDESSKHYNTSESLILSSSSDGEKSAQFKSCMDIDPSKEVLQQYADVTASCTKKISDLTAMIEKVREEKKKMLQSSTSSSDDKELTTTSYKDLPDERVRQKSPTQEELEKQLLGIDYQYAEKLKRLRQAEVQSERERAESASTDLELLTRLKALLDEKASITKKKVIIDDKSTTLISENTSLEAGKDETPSDLTTKRPTLTSNDQTPQLFLDIPKLPKLETPSLDKKKKKPPPSKGLRAFAGNTPHELSTIVEADSQLSTKIESKNNNGSDVPDILTEAQKQDKSHSNNSSDDISEMETMLMSIGMEWAIPTLKKTRETLALSTSTSSSSSVSLREFLSRISSSASKLEEGSLSETIGVSLIQMDNRRTSTPVVEHNGKKEAPIFLTDSDLSSVKEQSKKGSDENFYDLNEGSLTKTG